MLREAPAALSSGGSPRTRRVSAATARRAHRANGRFAGSPAETQAARVLAALSKPEARR